MFLGGGGVAISGVMYVPGWKSGGDQWHDVCSCVVEWGRSMAWCMFLGGRVVAINDGMYVPGW
jgi:hypothetical protein